MKKMMMKEKHSYIIRTALMAASGILLCGIAEAVRPEVDLSVGVPADKVVIADGILDQETQNDTDESFCDRLMKKMVHPIHMASRFLNGLGADSEEYVPSETEYNLMALRTEESAVDLSDPLAAFESLPWYKLAKRFRSMGTEDTWGAKMYEALGTRDAQWISEIYGWIQTTPLTASQKMGLPAAQVLGSYDPSNPEHNAQDPASWVVPTWKNIRFQICDGDGKPTSLASNATDILSMANVYTYSLDWKNTDLFNTYINQLWTSSHQYHVSISNVYYCEGCTELPDEPATEGTADDDVESGSAAGEASSEALDAQGAGDSQTAAEEPLTESEAASTANNYVKPAQGPGASTQEQAAESKAAASPSEATLSAESEAAVTLNENGKYCPGHVDLTITVKTTGLKEKHNLLCTRWNGKSGCRELAGLDGRKTDSRPDTRCSGLAGNVRACQFRVCTRESADTGRNCVLPGFTSGGFITGAACRYHMRAQFRWQDSILLWRKTEYSRTFRQSFCQRDKPGLQGTDFVRA